MAELCSVASATHWLPVVRSLCALHSAAQRLGVPETAVQPRMCRPGAVPVQLSLFEQEAA